MDLITESESETFIFESKSYEEKGMLILKKENDKLIKKNKQLNLEIINLKEKFEKSIENLNIYDQISSENQIYLEKIQKIQFEKNELEERLKISISSFNDQKTKYERHIYEIEKSLNPNNESLIKKLQFDYISIEENLKNMEKLNLELNENFSEIFKISEDYFGLSISDFNHLKNIFIKFKNEKKNNNNLENEHKIFNLMEENKKLNIQNLDLIEKYKILNDKIENNSNERENVLNLKNKQLNENLSSLNKELENKTNDLKINNLKFEKKIKKKEFEIEKLKENNKVEIEKYLKKINYLENKLKENELIFENINNQNNKLQKELSNK